jgi:signal transduction histidine kinase
MTATLARRLTATMLPWFLFMAALLAGVQIAVQFVAVNGAIDRDLATMARTLAPSTAKAVWELDQASLEDLAEGVMHNAIITGLRVVTSREEVLVAKGDLPILPSGADSSRYALAKTKREPLYFRTRHGERMDIGRLELHAAPAVTWLRLRAGIYAALATSLALAVGAWLIFTLAIRRHLAGTVTAAVRTVARWHGQPADAPVQRIQYPYQDELGELIAALNANRERLSVSMQDLNAVNLNLERIVEARTLELRAAKDAAESADRLKSAFLATMSHELRTPLNSIIGFTGVLLQELAGPLNPEQKKQMGMVRGSASHLLELINDVLDLSRIEAGQLQVAREPLDLGSIARKAVQTVQPLASRKGLQLACEAQEHLTITSDGRRVQQILMNLLSNAIKFTEAGEVRLRVECLADAVRIQVSDTGIGIAPGDLGRLFRPFSQIDSGLTRKYEGTGLGLSICRRLCDLLGGTIEAASAPGQGSCFTVTLPLAEAAS